MTAQLETPRGRYDKNISKSSLSMKPRFIEPVGERTNLRRLMLASFATAPDNLYMTPRLGRSFAPAATWNLHTTHRMEWLMVALDEPGEAVLAPFGPHRMAHQIIEAIV
jgi:hypothetical protein